MSHDISNDEVDSQIEEADRPFLRDRVYYAAKDGLSIAMFALLNNVKGEDTKNFIINQVRQTNDKLRIRVRCGIRVSTSSSDIFL